MSRARLTRLMLSLRTLGSCLKSLTKLARLVAVEGVAGPGVVGQLSDAAWLTPPPSPPTTGDRRTVPGGPITRLAGTIP